MCLYDLPLAVAFKQILEACQCKTEHNFLSRQREYVCIPPILIGVKLKKKRNTLGLKSCKVDMKTEEHGTLEVLKSNAQHDGELVADEKRHI